MRFCELFVLCRRRPLERWAFETHDEEMLGTITLDNSGSLSWTATQGNEQEMRFIFEDPVRFEVDGKVMARDEDPVGWFYALPFEYSGSYLRARIVDSPSEEQPRLRQRPEPSGIRKVGPPRRPR